MFNKALTFHKDCNVKLKVLDRYYERAIYLAFYCISTVRQ